MAFNHEKIHMNFPSPCLLLCLGENFCFHEFALHLSLFCSSTNAFSISEIPFLISLLSHWLFVVDVISFQSCWIKFKFILSLSSVSFINLVSSDSASISWVLYSSFMELVLPPQNIWWFWLSTYPFIILTFFCFYHINFFMLLSY